MAIIINNTETVKSKSQELKTQTKNLSSVKESIDFILGELNEYWSAVQEDQQEFYKRLQDDAVALDTICTCDDEFADAMVEYMEVTDKTSQTTV